MTATSGVAEGGCLGVAGRVTVLDPPIVTPAQKGPVTMVEGGTDGDSAFGQTEARLLEGDAE